MTFSLRKLIIGRPYETWRASEERLTKTVALPVFASDALSSSAYATEEILLALMLASVVAFTYSLPIALAIAVLVAIVAVSYRQTVVAYPAGGGAYTVARENLGALAGTSAAAALLIGYVLTVSVSVAAGVAAITSADPRLRPYAVALSIAFVVLITVANLRGVRESGLLFALPSYGFMLSVFCLLAVAGWKVATGAPGQPSANAAHTGGHPLDTFLSLRAFASG